MGLAGLTGLIVLAGAERAGLDAERASALAGFLAVLMGFLRGGADRLLLLDLATKIVSFPDKGRITRISYKMSSVKFYTNVL